MKIIFIILLSVSTLSSFSQALIKAEKTNKTSRTTEEISGLKKLRDAIEVNPNHLEAHNAYLYHARLNRIDTAVLFSQYSSWMERYPTSSVVPFVIGKFLYREESPKAKKYLLSAVKINPALEEAWSMLAIDASRWGDRNSESEYLQNAMKADPKNADIIFNYVYFLRKSDRIKSDSLMLDIAFRFPNDKAGADALYFLANDEDNVDRKISYYEQLYKRYSVLQPKRFRSGMSDYFSLLINLEAPEKAFDLALNMFFLIVDNKLEWKHKMKVAKSFMEVKKLIAEQKYEKALEMLNDITLYSDFNGSYVNAQESVLLLKAKLEDLLNNTQFAYDRIAAKYSKAPSVRLRNEVLKYATKLGKDSTLVDQEIRTIRYANARTADSVSFQTYESGKKISLQDLKGKVVLLTFWFPGCGPCRAEFPHLEAVIKKFNPDQVAYIGINGIPVQDDYVLPFMKATGYSFTPVKDNKDWDQEKRDGHGYPLNYLIDQNGYIISSGFMINETNEATLELLISDLLNSKN